MNPLVDSGSKLNLINEFMNFQKSMQGKDPQQIINSMVQSGKVSKDQVDNAVNMARQVSQFISSR